jgi:uncharacterized membrane protein YkvA (DUF1232 family)
MVTTDSRNLITTAEKAKSLLSFFISTRSLKENFDSMVEMTILHSKGQYKISSSSLALISVCLFYVVSPVDVVPDIIPVVGMMDDCAMVTITCNRISHEIETFKKWKKRIEEQQVTAAAYSFFYSLIDVRSVYFGILVCLLIYRLIGVFFC